MHLHDLLRHRPPPQADLAATLRRPRLEVQQAVAAFLARHLFETPRVTLLASAVAFARARRRPAPELGAGHPLTPEVRAVLLRALIGTSGPRTLRELAAATGRLIVAVDDFDVSFRESEVFATRDAFHVMRPDPEEAPARLHRLVSELAPAVSRLALPGRDALFAMLSGARPPETPLLAPVGRRLRRAPLPLLEAVGRLSFEAFAGAPTFDRATRATLHAFWREHRAILFELTVLQAPALIGIGPPRACPTWWTR